MQATLQKMISDANLHPMSVHLAMKLVEKCTCIVTPDNERDVLVACLCISDKLEHSYGDRRYSPFKGLSKQAVELLVLNHVDWDLYKISDSVTMESRLLSNELG